MARRRQVSAQSPQGVDVRSRSGTRAPFREPMSNPISAEPLEQLPVLRRNPRQERFDRRLQHRQLGRQPLTTIHTRAASGRCRHDTEHRYREPLDLLQEPTRGRIVEQIGRGREQHPRQGAQLLGSAIRSHVRRITGGDRVIGPTSLPVHDQCLDGDGHPSLPTLATGDHFVDDQGRHGQHQEVGDDGPSERVVVPPVPDASDPQIAGDQGHERYGNHSGRHPSQGIAHPVDRRAAGAGRAWNNLVGG